MFFVGVIDSLLVIVTTADIARQIRQRCWTRNGDEKLVVVACACSGSASRWCRSTRRSARSRASTTCIKPTRSTNTQVDAAAIGDDRVRFEPAQRAAVDVSRRCERSVRMHPGELTTVMYRGDATTPTALSPDRRFRATGPQVAGVLLQEARMFLLHAADAAAGRGAPDAGRVRGRNRTAGGREYHHAVVYVLRGRRHGRAKAG